MTDLTKDELRTLKAKALSDTEIREALDNNVNIIKYDEIPQYKSLSQLLGRSGRCVILFELKENNGHWCSIVEVNNGKEHCIIFTDPYGLYPENELSYVPVAFRKISHEDRGFLLRLFKYSPLQVRYSQYRLQKMKNGINTCGRYAIIRCAIQDMDEDQFNKFLRSTKYSPDDVVTMLTYDV